MECHKVKNKDAYQNTFVKNILDNHISVSLKEIQNLTNDYFITTCSDSKQDEVNFDCISHCCILNLVSQMLMTSRSLSKLSRIWYRWERMRSSSSFSKVLLPYHVKATYKNGDKSETKNIDLSHCSLT